MDGLTQLDLAATLVNPNVHPQNSVRRGSRKLDSADEDSEGGTSPLLRTVASGRGYSVKYRGGDRVCEGGAIEMSSGQRTIEVGADESAHHYI